MTPSAPPPRGKTRGVIGAAAGAVVHNRRLMRLVSGYALMAAYEMGIWVAVLLWAYDVGGVQLAGVAAFLQMFAAAPLAPLGDRLVGRWRRDRSVSAVYATQGLLMLVLAAVLRLASPPGVVIASATLVTIVIAWTRPQHYSALGDLATSPSEAAAGNALSGTVEGVGYFVGPVVAGVLVGVGEPALAAVVFGVAALIAAGLTWELELLHTAARQDDFPATGPHGVVKTLWQQPFLAAVLVLVGVSFVVQGAWEVLAVTYVGRDAGAGGAGLLVGSIGIGTLIGASCAILLVRWQRLAGAVAGGLSVGGLPLVLLAGNPPVEVALAVGVVSGCGLGFFSVAGVTALQRSVDGRQVSQLIGLREAAVLGGAAIGAILAPVLVDWSSAGGAYALLGLMLIGVAVVALPVLVRVDATTRFRPEVVTLLRAMPTFRVLDLVSVERLAQAAVRVEVPAGSAVVTEGEHGDAYYVVASGTLQVHVGGRPKAALLVAGDGFGEIALLRDMPRTATVTAVDDCELWSISRADFLGTVTGSAATPYAEATVDAYLSDDAGPAARRVGTLPEG
jgi:MFS family permease